MSKPTFFLLLFIPLPIVIHHSDPHLHSVYYPYFYVEDRFLVAVHYFIVVIEGAKTFKGYDSRLVDK